MSQAITLHIFASPACVKLLEVARTTRIPSYAVSRSLCRVLSIGHTSKIYFVEAISPAHGVAKTLGITALHCGLNL